VVFLHGGPEDGTSPAVRRFFDPDFYRIVLLYQVIIYSLRPTKQAIMGSVPVKLTQV
jgi:hypothetical protein